MGRTTSKKLTGKERAEINRPATTHEKKVRTERKEEPEIAPGRSEKKWKNVLIDGRPSLRGFHGERDAVIGGVQTSVNSEAQGKVAWMR